MSDIEQLSIERGIDQEMIKRLTIKANNEWDREWREYCRVYRRGIDPTPRPVPLCDHPWLPPDPEEEIR